jgi:predicted outer membrane repeat protein
MKKTFLPLIMGFLLLFASLATHATIKYVKASATGLNNGNSWANAYTDLQSALASSSDTIWVANGTYKPTSTSNRNISFNMSERNIFGGFVGTEVNLNDRNYSTFQTILDGDIGIVGDSTDNTYNVGTITGGTIDGFVVRNGNNTNSSSSNNIPYGGGGGLSLYGFSLGSPSTIYVNNCHFQHNYAQSGGALVIFQVAAVVNNCMFDENRAGLDGGAITSYGTSAGSLAVRITDSKITKNKANNGGAISGESRTSLVLNRCFISDNIANEKGGAIYGTLAPQIKVNNSLIVGNRAQYSSAIHVLDGSSFGLPPTIFISYSTVVDNKALNSGCLFLGSSNVVSVLSGSIIWGNGDSTQISTSPLVANNCTKNFNLIQNSSNSAGNTFNFDPQFVNPNNFANAPFDASLYSYKLLPASLANDTSLAVVNINYLTDLAGFTRDTVAPWDLGCYEHCTMPVVGSITGPSVICNGAIATLAAPTGGTQYLWNSGDTTNTINTNVTGNYIVTVKTGSNCEQSFQHQVTVSQPSSISGDSTICYGGTKQLTISGDLTSYNWNTNDTSHSITVQDTGTYYMSGTNSNGCFSSDTIHISYPPQPPFISILGDSVICQDDSITLTTNSNLTLFYWYNYTSPNPVFASNRTIVDSGTVWVKGTDAYGCVASDTVHVQAGALPLVVITGDSIICPNGSVTLTAIGNSSSFQWNNADTTQIITINDSNIYYVTGKNNIGCTAADTFHVQMGELPIPTISQTGSTLSTTTAFTSYQWYKDNVAIVGATQQQYTATQSGSYSVKVTNTNGCEGISNALSYATTAINGINKNNNLNIYPNPANKYAIIDLENLSDKINSYSIVDIWGRVIETNSNGTLNGKTLKIDLQNIAAGSYYIKLQGLKQQHSLKLTIVK